MPKKYVQAPTRASMADNRNPRRIQSVERAINIIETLRDQSGATGSEIADEVGLSAGTVSTYLTTLREQGYIRLEDGEYHLGLFLLPLGEYVRLESPLYKAGKAIADELAEETGEVAQLITQNKGKEIQVYGRLGPNAVGERLYTENKVRPKPNLHCSAAGKVMIAHMDPEQREQLLAEYELFEQTENTITNKEQFEAELKTIQVDGVAFNDEEQVSGLRAVAAPVCSEGRVFGAISLASPVSRLQNSRLYSEFPDQVREAANIIEVNINTSGWDDPLSRSTGGSLESSNSSLNNDN